jgi:hypothetical protein
MPYIGTSLLPASLKVPAAVAGFRANIGVKRPLLESLFGTVTRAREKAERLEPTIASWFDDMETLRQAFIDPERKNMIWEAAAHRALFTDSAAALILIVDAEMDRLYRESQTSLFGRGVDSYVPGITVSSAVHGLANQYKHLGKWRATSGSDGNDKAIIRALVGDPLLQDAAAEFLRRGFSKYNDLEAAILSCADGIVTDGTIPATGRGGIPFITMNPVEE